MLDAKQIAQNSELLPVRTTMTSRKNRGHIKKGWEQCHMTFC